MHYVFLVVYVAIMQLYLAYFNMLVHYVEVCVVWHIVEVMYISDNFVRKLIVKTLYSN